MSSETYTRVMDLFTGILVGYAGGYFLWLFVYWYTEERPKQQRGKIKELTKGERDYYKNLGKPRDPKLPPVTLKYFWVLDPNGDPVVWYSWSNGKEAIRKYADHTHRYYNTLIDEGYSFKERDKPTSPPPTPKVFRKSGDGGFREEFYNGVCPLYIFDECP